MLAASSVLPYWPQAGSHSGDGSTGGRAEAGIGGALPPPTCTLRTVTSCTRLSRAAARRPSPAPRAESPAGGRPAAASGAPPSPERGARLESTRAAPQAALARGRLTADCAPAPKTPPQHVNVGGDRAPASGSRQSRTLALCGRRRRDRPTLPRRGLARGPSEPEHLGGPSERPGRAPRAPRTRCAKRSRGTGSGVRMPTRQPGRGTPAAPPATPRLNTCARCSGGRPSRLPVRSSLSHPFGHPH